MKYTISLTFDSLKELQDALSKLDIVNTSPPCIQPKNDENVSENDLRGLLIKYCDSGKQTRKEIQDWMQSTWGSAFLKDIDPKHFPEIKKEVEARL